MGVGLQAGQAVLGRAAVDRQQQQPRAHFDCSFRFQAEFLNHEST
jgi:hypothetical protein